MAYDIQMALIPFNSRRFAPFTAIAVCKKFVLL